MTHTVSPRVPLVAKLPEKWRRWTTVPSFRTDIIAGPFPNISIRNPP